MSISLSPTRGQKRQTVVSGPAAVAVNSATPNLLTASNLFITANSSITPVVLSFAAGFGSRGAIDHIVWRKVADEVGLTPNATSYLYYERNPINGVISLGATTSPVDYGPYPLQQVNGAAWFSTIDYVMRTWNGSAWVPVQRIYCGEAITNGFTTTKLVTYAYNGEYLSPPRAVAGAAAYTFEHNLGVTVFQSNFVMYGASATGPLGLQNDFFSDLGSSYGYVGYAPSAIAYTIGTGTFPVITPNTGVWSASGTYWLRAGRAF